MFGPTVDDILSSSHVLEIPVGNTDTVYTKSFSLVMGEYFSLFLKATSDGAVKLKIELEQSHKLPTTEGASDETYVIPNSASDVVSSLEDEISHIYKQTPICLPFGRLKITGLSGNDASTTLRARIGIRG